MKFQAKVVPAGNATAVEIPGKAMQDLGPEARPAITISINGHSWRSRVALKNGKALIGISAANREAAGIAKGDTVTVDAALDTAPRTVAAPKDLATAFGKRAGTKAAFDVLPFGLRQKYVREIEEAKSPETRKRRIDKLVETLKAPK